MIRREVLDAAYWRGLLPRLGVEAPGTSVKGEQLAVTEEEIAQIRQIFDEEGYFQWLPVDWGVDFELLAQAVETLMAGGWPPVFCFVYDDFWRLITRVAGLLGNFLGQPVQRLPDIWAWHLDPGREQTGWEPHRDKGRQALFEDGSPKSLTYWLPLRDATPLNGCLYLLPAHLDPHYNTELEKRPNVRLSDVRALPCPAGTVSVWNQEVLHWSGRASSRAPLARVSISCEYQRADVPPFKTPLEDAATLPPFARRLGLIARQMLQYRHMAPLTPAMEDLVAWLLAQPPGRE